MGDPPIESRKKDHVDIVAEEGAQTEVSFWRHAHLVHHAVPELDLPRVDVTTGIFGIEVAAPVIVSGMTGGYKDATQINDHLAHAAADQQIPMGVGSQRAALENPDSAETFSVVADHDVPVRLANIGAPQLIPQGDDEALTLEDAETARDMVDAHALALHLNFAQEVVQPEGDEMGRGVLDALSDLVDDLDIPVYVKETGSGIGRAAAEALKPTGIAAIDTGGVGGTSFTAVERVRAREAGDELRQRIGELFGDWGVPTPASIVEADVGLPVFGTGGLRTGVDVAKAIALGADAGGMARPFLMSAKEGRDAAVAFAEQVVEELRVAMFLTGARDVRALGDVPVVTTGPLRTWLDQRGFDPGQLAQRG